MCKKTAGLYHHEVNLTPASLSLIFVMCLSLLCIAQPARAAVVWSGDVDPDDPTTWDYWNTTGYIGKTDNGTLDITDGSEVESEDGYIGYEPGSTGEVTVNGTGSKWDNNSDICVGYKGSGTLNITSGSEVLCERGRIACLPGSIGNVTVNGVGSIWNVGPKCCSSNRALSVGVAGVGVLNISNGGTVIGNLSTKVASAPGSSGSIHFSNGTLQTPELYCASNDLTGIGTINTNGLVSDIDLIFDARHGLEQTFIINDEPGQYITVNLAVDGYHSLGAGYGGSGTLSISDGITVESSFGYIGEKIGSIGRVTVDGNGSTWKFHPNLTVNGSGFLYIGRRGSGTLNITNGGTIDNYTSYIGTESGSTGQVQVDGTGSTWINNSNLSVGFHGSGILNITDGGLVSVADTLKIFDDDDEKSYINMATGGMLALFGDRDDSLADFMSYYYYKKAIRCWDYSISDWADMSEATFGEDYTLNYITEGDMTGYTILTVSTPEPAEPGDANHDGLVDEADAAVLCRFWQTESGAFWGMGDFNDDGAVNDIDATILAANWQGATSPPELFVPEPSLAVGLLWLAAAILGMRNGIQRNVATAR